jgi:hypothetical protein
MHSGEGKCCGFIFLFIYSFIQHLAEYNRAAVPVLIKVSMTLSLIYFVT